MVDVSNEVVEVLEALGEKLGVAIDWSSKNMLPYAQELCQKYITWEICTSIVWIVIGIIFLLAPFIVIGKKTIKALNSDSLGDKEIFPMIFLFEAGLGVGFAFLCGHQVFDIVKGITFPELMLYEYAKTILN